MKERLKLTEVWFKLGLFILFGLLYFVSMPYPAKSKQFPQLIAMISTALIVISLVMDFTRKQILTGEITDVGETELKIVDGATRKVRRGRFYKAWGIILISMTAGFLGGFLFTTCSLFMGFALVFGEKTRKVLYKNTLVAIGMTVLIYLIFQRIMGVPLLTGAFW
ncbi:MAG: tripartite tricarboxylate transporter TctB family protein [Desulfobacterales bacterium]|nr:tripartite tricarboxylate transporter TctB family protein [Desulfobacterales bacterium]